MFLISICVVIGQTANFSLLISIASSLVLIFDLIERYSVTPIFLSNFLSIGQLIIPTSLLFNAISLAKFRLLITNFDASF